LLFGLPAFSATVTDMTPELEGLICTLLDGGDNLVSGDTMTADVVGPGGVPDGVDDFTITYTEFSQGAATGTASCDGAGAVSVRSSTSGAAAGDYGFLNICIDFLPGAEVSAANLADFSLSSANGGSVEYEFGLIEVTPRGMPKTVTGAILSSYNVDDYPNNGGANTLIHDLFTPAQQEGIGFYTDTAVTINTGPCGTGVDAGGGCGPCDFTSSTGVASGQQHYQANAIGGNIFNFYSTAAAQAAVTDVGSISFWYGVFDVNDCSSSSPSGSMSADEQTVCVPPPPCEISDVVASDPMCSGNDATFNVSFTVANGGGSFDVVAATADAANGITAGQILATGAASPISVTIPGPTAAGSFDVNIVDTTALDAAGNMCSGTAVTVSIPVCEIPPNPCISLSKEADLVGALAGETVTYTIIATNCGEALLTNVMLTDALLGATLSAPMSISGDATVANGMDTNEAWQWTATYVVSQADVDSAMQLVNNAMVAADSSAGPVDASAEAVVCVSPSCTKSTGACFIEIDFDEPAFEDILGAPIAEGGEGATAGQEVQSPTGDPFNWTYGFNVIEDGTCNEWDAATYAARPATDQDDVFITYTAINQTPLPTVAGAPGPQEVRAVVSYNQTSGGRLTFLKRISNPGDADQDVFIQPGSLYGGQVTVTFGDHITVVAEDPKNPANRTNFRQSSSYTSTDYWEHGIGSFVGDALAARPSNQGYLFTECDPPVVPGNTGGTSTVTPGYTTPAPTGIWYIDNCVLNTETQCGDLNHPLGENAGSGNSVDPNGTIFASTGPGTLNGGPCGPVTDNAGMAPNAVISAISFMGVQEVSEPYNGPENPNAVPEDNGNFFGYETQNSGGIISFQSFCFVVNQPEACLGLAKEVEPVDCPNDDGTVDLNYTLRLCNEGNCADLTRVQVVEDLLQFIPAADINSVSAPVISVPPATGTLTLDPAFDGQTNIRILDEFASDLPFGECAEITFTVNVLAPDCVIAWTNQATAWGMGDGACTYDISYDDGTAGSLATTDGMNPDFDSTGDGTADVDCPNTDSNETVIALDDTTPPEAACLAGPLQFKIDETGMLTLDLDQVIDVAGITDNCAIGSTQIMNNVFDCDSTGDIMIDVTLTDVCGNQNVLMCPVTILPCTEPGITVSKNCVVSDCPNGDGNFEVVCSIEVVNSGTAPLIDLSVDDSLAPLFGPFFVSGSITAFDNTAAPNVMQNTGYNGAGANGLVAGVAVGTPFNPGETVRIEITALLGANSCGQQFVNDVVYDATDDCGRLLTGSSSATIFVGDFEPPVARCQNITIGPGGSTFLTADEIDNGSSDDCGIVTRTLSTAGPFTCDQVGDFPVTLTVADACGNTDSCIATVTVVSCDTLLSGFVFHDDECNRGQDSSNDPIPGVTVTLWTDPNCDGDFLDGSPIQTNLTDSTGLFVFTGLVGGCFVVVQEDLPGWWSTSSSGAPQNNPNAVAVSLSCCMNFDGVEFRDTRPETNFTDTVIEDCCETIVLREWTCKNECDCDALICTQRIVLTNDIELEPCPVRGPFYLGCNPTLPTPDPGVFSTAGGCDIVVEYSHFVDVTNGCLTTRTNIFNMSDACGNTQQCTEVWIWTDDLEPPIPTMVPTATNTLDCVCIGDPLPLPDPTNGLSCADNCDGFAVVAVSNMAMLVTNMSVSMQSTPVTNSMEVVTTNEVVTMITTSVVDSVETNQNPAFQTLQINEVLPNPSGSDGNGVVGNTGEFIELVGPPGLDISCWILTDGDWTITIPPGFTIPADGIVFIAVAGYTGGSSGGTCPDTAGYSDIDIELSTCGCISDTGGGGNGFVFTNGGEHLGIYSNDGTFVSGFIYGNPSAGNTPAGDASYPLSSPGAGACPAGVSIAAAPTASYAANTTGSSDDVSYQNTDAGYTTGCMTPGTASEGQTVSIVTTNFVDMMIPVTNMMAVTADVETVTFTNTTVTNFTTNTVFTPVVITGAVSCVIEHVGDITNITPCEISVTRTWRFSDSCGNFVEREQVYLFPVNDKVAPACLSGPTNLMLGCNPGGVEVLMPTPADYVFTDTCGVQAVWISNQVTVAEDCAFTRTLTIAAIDNCGNVTTKMTTVTWTEDNEPPTITNFPTSLDLGCNPSAADISDALDGFGAGGGGGGAVPVVPPWINELHYDNAGTDENECVEIAGQAGSSLAGWSIEFLNGNGGTVYATLPLSGTIPNTVNGYGALCFCQAGLQNGAPDGLVLVDPALNPVLFLSYEGSFMATGGAANGMTSTDIGVSESSATGPMDSLQLVGSGTAYGDFTWAAPSTSSCGTPNANQTFDVLTPVPSLEPSFGAVDNCGLCTQTLVCATNTIGCATVIECIFTAIDCCGNVAQREATISWQEDDLPPTFTCPPDQAFGCNPVIPAPDPAIITNATDEGCGLVEVSFVGDGVTFQDCETMIERVYSAIDECGNVSSCTQIFTFISDQSPPEVVLIPADIELGCQVTRDDIPAPGEQMFIGADNCNLVATNFISDTETTQDCVIVILRVYEFVDECGNVKYGQQTIRFSENTVVAPPTCTSPGTFDLGCNPTPPIPDPSRVRPASDCGIVRVEFLGSEDSEVGCMTMLTHLYLATDVCGQVVTCEESFVWIDDLSAPEIVGMPANSNSMVCIDDVTLLPLPAPQTNEVICIDECASSGVAPFAIAGSSSAYTDTGGDWLTLAANDIDASGGLGTDGWFFFGDFDGASANGQPFTHSVASLPAYVATLGPGADFASVAAEFGNYGLIDNPLLLNGTDGLGGFAVTTGAGAGIPLETATFTIGALLPDQTVRVGILAGLEGNQDGRWDPTSIGLSDGSTILTVGDHTASPLPASPGGVNAGWIYFDISTPGTYAVLVTKRLDTQGAGVGGFTFDSVVRASPSCPVEHVADFTNVAPCEVTVERVYRVTDDCGNTAVRSQFFTWPLNDGTAPIFIDGPSSADLGCNPDPVDLLPPPSSLFTFLDPCDFTVAFVTSEVTMVSACVMSQDMEYVAMDKCGNTATQAIYWTWTEDTTPPTLTACPNPTNIGCVADAAAAMAAVAAIPPAVTDIVGTDNCATVSVIFLADRVKVQNCSGTVTRQFRLSDDCGNSIQHDQLFHFSINDGTGPYIQSLPVLALGCIDTPADIPFADPTLVLAADFCPIGNAEHLGDVTNGSDCAATITRTYAVADLCGNTSTVEQIITYAYDETEPVIIAAMPRNVDLGCITDLTQVAAANPGLITATDDCGVVAITNVLDITNNVAGTCRWTVDRSYHVVDACGNFTDYDEHIDFVLDTGAPVIDFAASMPTNVDLTPNCNPVIPAPNPAGVVATDDCGVERVDFVGESRDLSGCESTITRVYIVYDGCGNSTNFVQTLNYYDDSTPPQVQIVPRNVNLGCAFDLQNVPPPSSNVNLTNDNCAVTQNGSTDYVSTQGCVMVVDRVYEFSDLCGNLAFGVQTFRFSTAATVAAPTCMDEPVHFLGCNPTVPPPNSARVTPMSDCGIIKTDFVSSFQVTNNCVVTRTNFYESTDICGQEVTCTESFIWTEDITPPTIVSFPSDENIVCVDATALPVPTADVSLVVCADDCQEIIVLSNDMTITTQDVVTTEVVPMTNIVSTTIVENVVTTTGGMTNLMTNTMNVVTNTTVTNVVMTNTDMVVTNVIPGAITEIEINEVLADASGTEGAGAGGVGGEFIEFIGPPGTDVSCFVFTDGDVVITIPDGTLIPTDGILLFASSAYSDGMNGISNYAGLIDVDINTCGCITNTSGGDVWNLTNGGEHFGLYDASGAFVAGFIYGSPNAGNMIGGGNEYGGTVPALGACSGGFTITAGATNLYDSAPFADGAANSDFSYQLVSNGVYTTTFMTPGSATIGAPSSEVVTNTVTMSITNIVTVPVTNMVDVITTNITGGMTVTQQTMVATNVEVVTFDSVSTTNTIVTTNDNPVLGFGGSGCAVTHVGDVTSRFDCVSTVVRVYRIADSCGNWIERVQTLSYTHDDATGPALLSGPSDRDLGCNPNTVPAYNAADFAFEDQPCGVDTVWISRDEFVSNDSCALVREIDATARDLCGNTTTVTVVTRWTDDTTAPVLTCPADEDLGCFIDSPAVIPPAFTNAAGFVAAGGTVSDDCGATLQLISEQALVLPGCNEGLTRTYLAIDPCGNVETCSQTFTWKASTAPVLTCPPSQDLSCNPSAADLPNAFSLGRQISVSAACNTSMSNIVDDLVFDGVCGFTHTLQFAATDECGNRSVGCPIVYTWRVDEKPPVVQTTQAGGFLGCTGNVPPVDTNAVTATDEGCGVMMVTHEADVTTAIGCFTTVRRTYRIMDQCGNFTDEIVTFTFSNDTAPPTVIQSVEPIVFACNPSSIPPANPTQIVAIDDCGTPLVAHVADGIPLAGCVASLERLYSVSDDCGNVLIITQQISYTLDQTPPVVSIAPANIDLGCNPTTLPPATDAINVISDGCKIIGTNITSTVTTNGCRVTMRRNYVFDDICDNLVVGQQILTWTEDSSSPNVDLAASRATNVFFGCNPGVIPGPNPFDVAALDDCGGVTVTWIGDDNVLGDCAVMLKRRYLLEDPCGNQSVHTQTFSYISDDLPPVIQVQPASIELGCNIDLAIIPAPMTEVTVASDSCQILSTNWIGDSVAVTNGCDITITRSYEFEDFCGNKKTATQTIRYSESSTAPILAVPPDRDLGCNPPAADIPSLFDILSQVVIQVDCGSGSVTGTMAETTSGCLRTRTFDITGLDDCGLSTTETTDYTWSDDSDLPLVTSAPSGADLGCNPDSIPAPDTSLVIATDDCGATVSHISDTTETNGCDVTMRRRYAIVDDCGNRALEDVIYTWQESSDAPSIDIQPVLDLGCSPDIGDIPTRADVLALANVSSDCVPATLNATMTAVTNSCLVMQSWSLTTSDVCGRTATATFIARWLQDDTPPTITSRAPDAALGCNPAGGGAPAPNLASIVATDDCGTVSISHLSDQETVDGCEHTLFRTYRATDVCGNQTDQVITYTWTEDTDPPAVNCPANLEIQAFDECIALTPDLAVQLAPVESCGTLTLRQNPAPGTPLNGNDANSITLTAIDDCGNESSCTIPVAIMCMPEIELLKTVVLGHDAACPGVEVVDGFMGEPVTFCFEVINVGRVDLENVVIDDALIGDGISIPIGDLAVGESKIASANGEITGITNVATAVGGAVNSGIAVSDSNVAFTQPPCGCAAGAVFIDLSNDGTPSNDNLENVGIAGVDVNIYQVNDDGSETFIATTTTGPNGMYNYTLPSGNYRVEIDSSTVPVINTPEPGGLDPSQSLSLTMCECTPDDLDDAPNFAIAPSPTAAKLTGASASGGSLAWSTSAEVDVIGYYVIDVATGERLNEAIILAVGGAGDYEFEVGPGEYIIQEVSHGLEITETARLTHQIEVDASPTGEPTQIVTTTPFVTSEGVASYLLTGIAAGAQAFDVTSPDAPILLLGERLETSAGQGLYFSYPTGATIEVRTP